jgi:hypothetical protein
MIGVNHALVDLAKDRDGVAGIGWKHEGGVILDWPLERQFGTRKYADSHRTIFRRGESSVNVARIPANQGGLELRNVVAKYPFERSHRFSVIEPNSGRRDYSRSSCDGGRCSSGA